MIIMIHIITDYIITIDTHSHYSRTVLHVDGIYCAVRSIDGSPRTIFGFEPPMILCVNMRNMMCVLMLIPSVIRVVQSLNAICVLCWLSCYCGVLPMRGRPDFGRSINPPVSPNNHG